MSTIYVLMVLYSSSYSGTPFAGRATFTHEFGSELACKNAGLNAERMAIRADNSTKATWECVRKD